MYCRGALAQENYVAPFFQKRADSTFRHFDVAGKRISGWLLTADAGVFVPQGHLSVLGPHLYLGGSTGWRFNKFMFNFALYGRFSNAPGDYTIKYKDTLYRTDSYTGGGYLGLDLGYALWQNRKHEVDVTAGTGMEFFDAVFGNKDSAVFNSGNVHLGVGYTLFIHHLKCGKYILKGYALRNSVQHRKGDPVFTDIYGTERYSYLTFQVKYNFLDFANPGGTNLSGGAITAGIVYGFCRRPMPMCR